MLKVPFIDFTRIPHSLKDQWLDAAAEVIESGVYIGGDFVSRFESDWAETIGTRFAVGVGNGLDGLTIALKALGVGPGDFVAVPAHTFIATWSAVSLVGAKPIGIDVNQFGLLDLDLLESAPYQFKAVIPVHMHGMMVDMDRLQNWCRLKSVYIVEDASQAHLAKQGERYAGNCSEIGVFSLYPSKNLGALGDAGVVTTNNPDLASSIKSYANYGSTPEDKYRHSSLGVNSRLDPLQAAFLLVNNKHLSAWNMRRSQIADMYLSQLKNNSWFTPLNPGSESSVWHHFPVLTRGRALLQSKLKEAGIGTEIHYPHLAALEHAEIFGQVASSFPVGNQIASQILSLPISPWHSDEQINYVCTELNSITG
jgi:dTDP-4-amino-4,6-dideoxygalactose transaminase